MGLSISETTRQFFAAEQSPKQNNHKDDRGIRGYFGLFGTPKNYTFLDNITITNDYG